MKSLLTKLAAALIGVWAFMGVANAEQVVVYEAPVDASSRINSVLFGVNRDLGRAWVDIGVQFGWSGSEPSFEPPIERQVEGLYYDAARKQVIFRSATGPIVCAEDASTLGGISLKSTGNCRLTSSTEQRRVEDGFDVHEQTVAKVVLDAQTPSDRQQAAAAR